MELVNLQIETTDQNVEAFKRLADQVGAVLKVTSDSQSNPLKDLIDEAEKDFAEGRGTTMTIEQLRAMVNEVA